MDEADRDLFLRLVVTSGVSCGVLVGGVVAVNACVSAARVWMLGGVTTLDRELGIDCTMCRYPMEVGDDVRTLSCGHVFHKACSNSIDKWLRESHLTCPICREKARSVRVLPWKARPQPQTHVGLAQETDLEALGQLLPPPGDESPRGAAPTAVVEFVELR